MGAEFAGVQQRDGTRGHRLNGAGTSLPRVRQKTGYREHLPAEPDLARLRDAGHLSAEEFEAKQREIIGRL